MAHAVPILKYNPDEEERYSLDTEALSEILNKPDIQHLPIMVFSIAGLARKGKSFLLNFVISYLEFLEKGIDEEYNLLETRLDSFEFLGGRDRVTVGIFMWNRPFIVTYPNGKKVAIFVTDTQGTFDANSSYEECASIFALSTLISSLQVYNIMQGINESDLQNLACFTALAKAAGGPADSSPHLHFLQRDWPSSDQDPFGREGGETYVNDILKIAKNRRLQQNTELREDIRAAFDKISGFNMPRPGKINSDKDCEISRLEPEFLTYLKQFLQETFSLEHLAVKKIDSQEMAPGNLFHRIHTWMECFGGNKIPKMTDVYTCTLRADDDHGMEKALNQFNRNLNEYLERTKDWINKEEQFQLFLKDQQKEATETFLNAPGLADKTTRRRNNLKELNKKLNVAADVILTVVLRRHKVKKERRDKIMAVVETVFTVVEVVVGTAAVVGCAVIGALLSSK